MENTFELGPFPTIKLGTVTASAIGDLCSPSGELTRYTNEYWRNLKKIGFEVPTNADIPAKLGNKNVTIHVGEAVAAR